MPTLKSLPDCEGPKLECFTDDLLAHDFRFLTVLGTGTHSAVVKAEIDGKVYAIKIFTPLGATVPCAHLCPLQKDPWSADNTDLPDKEIYGWSDSLNDTLILQATSFHNECRVFGRLKEVGREDLAVRVHGYIPLHLMNEQVEEQFKIALANSSFSEFKSGVELLRHQENPNEPLMAIVKDWIQGDSPVYGERTVKEGEWERPTVLYKMLRNLKELHKCGIVVRDLKEQQYLGSTLIDFSHAWTIPHVFGPEGGIHPRWAFASMAAWDLYCFQWEVIGEWNSVAEWPENKRKPCHLVAYRGINGRSIGGIGQSINQPSVYDRLRQRPGKQGPFLPLLTYDSPLAYMTEDPPYDPALFDWRRAADKKGKGTVVRKRKAAVEQPRPAKKTKSADESKKEKKFKPASNA